MKPSSPWRIQFATEKNAFCCCCCVQFFAESLVFPFKLSFILALLLLSFFFVRFWKSTKFRTSVARIIIQHTYSILLCWEQLLNTTGNHFRWLFLCLCGCMCVFIFAFLLKFKWNKNTCKIAHLVYRVAFGYCFFITFFRHFNAIYSKDYTSLFAVTCFELDFFFHCFVRYWNQISHSHGFTFNAKQ